MTVTKKPIAWESTKEAVKTIACGNAGLLRWTCGDYARVLTSHFAREAAGALGARHSPRPRFSGANVLQKLGRIAPRDRGVIFDVIARSDLSAVAQRAKAEATK